MNPIQIAFLLFSIALCFFLSTLKALTVKEFYISEAQLSWYESVDYCQSVNKSLLSIKSESFDKYVTENLSNVTLPGNLWISGTESQEGVWYWNSTGEPFYHTRWFIGQPDDIENLSCVYMAITARFYWRDANCSAPMYFICQE